VLPLTLGWKLAAHRPASASEERLEDQSYQKVAGFLIRQHFSVSRAEKMEPGATSVVASAGLCRVLVASSSPGGSERDTIRSRATPEDTVFVVFRGKIYAEQPIWLTVADSLWVRFARHLGLEAQALPPLFIVARKSCGAERLPWNELSLSRPNAAASAA
jgi:hypothetical protein